MLARDRFRTWISMEQVEAYVDAIRHHAELVDEPDELTSVSRDPDDDYLIALARAARVDALVSGDEDLTSLELDDLDILTPRQMLNRLLSGPAASLRGHGASGAGRPSVTPNNRRYVADDGVATGPNRQARLRSNHPV